MSGIRLFFGGLPLDATEDECLQKFRSFGVEKVKIIYDGEQCRGFAYVTVDNEENSEKRV
jgi:RNA recognition motif-containing protein